MKKGKLTIKKDRVFRQLNKVDMFFVGLEIFTAVLMIFNRIKVLKNGQREL